VGRKIIPDPGNIFLVGRESGAEDQLTEMLVWLADAVPDVGAAVMRLGLGDIDVELPQIEASTQQGIAAGRLDALFTSETSIVVVESKLQSSYGEGQLRKYIDWLGTNDRAHRVLMTLTERNAPWPPDELARASEVNVTASARRWQDLYVALNQVANRPEGGLSARLVQEFQDMLAEEGLIPVKPLEGEELTDAWSRSQAIIERYHEYFRTCKDAIADALEAPPHPNRASAQATYVYQDFATVEGELIGVGLNYSDHGFPITPKVYRNAPIVWLTIEANDWPGWESAIASLEANPPEGWRVNPNRWYYRPQVWRYLDEIIGAGTFEEQRARLAAACGQGRGWLLSGRPQNYRPRRRRRRG
jgi:hypothetical protein